MRSSASLSSQVPRLHALAVRPLPLPSPPLPARCTALDASAAAELAAAAPVLRPKVIAALTSCLGGTLPTRSLHFHPTRSKSCHFRHVVG